jgi:colanic acid/amylovoran biosynthesis glycosyltransferase
MFAMAAAFPDRSDESPFDDTAPIIATYRSPLFNASEGFVAAQALSLRRYQPVVCGRNRTDPVDARLAGRVILAETREERLMLDLGRPPARFLWQLRRWNPVLVHAHFATDGLIALPIAEQLDVPLVTSLRGYDITRSPASLLSSGSLSKARYALLGDRLRRKGALFLAVCDYLRDRAIAQGFPEERTLTHYNGVNLRLFAPLSAAPRDPLILHVGRLAEKKGTSVLLHAFARLGAEHAATRLAVIGDGPLRKDLQHTAATLGIADRIDWLGMITRPEVARWMQQAQLLAIPSLTASDGNAEGLPNVVVEAAASGLPVVATRHAGIPEAVIHGVTGLLVPEGDASALAQALREILAAPSLGDQLGVAARRLAESKFDYLVQMDRLEQHYDRIISGHHANSGVVLRRDLR